MRNFYNFCARVRKAFLRDDYLYHQIAYFMTIISIIIILLAIVLYPEIVKAEETSYRCGNNIVSVGDSIADLRALCPEPLEKFTGRHSEAYSTKNNGVIRNIVTRTTYLYGQSGEFIREVIVIEGTIVQINVTNARMP